MPAGTGTGFNSAVWGDLAYRFGGQDPEAGQIARFVTAAVQGGLFDQHVNDRRRRGSTLRSAAGQSGNPHWQARVASQTPQRATLYRNGAGAVGCGSLSHTVAASASRR